MSATKSCCSCHIRQEKFKGNIPKLVTCFSRFFLRMAMLYFFKLQQFIGSRSPMVPFFSPANFVLGVFAQMIIFALTGGEQSLLGFRKAGPEIFYLRK